MKVQFIKFLTVMVFLLGVCVHAYGLNFNDFKAALIINEFDITLDAEIIFTSPLDLIASSGTIKGNGNVLNGDNQWKGFSFNAALLEPADNYNIYFIGDITLTRFFRQSSASGSASQGGAIFAVGVSTTGGLGSGVSEGITKIDFILGTINITSSTLSAGVQGSVAQGGGIFAGGAVSAGSSDSGSNNNSSSGTVIIRISSSSINITSSTLSAGNLGTVVQGGGIFAGGAVSAGSNSETNNSSSGTVIIRISSSSVNITSSTLRTSDYGTAAQGGGIFAGGSVSAGSDWNGTNNSSSGTVIISISSSSVNITSSTLSSAGGTGTAAQGGGIFAGGAVSAGSDNSGSNNSSSGTVIISFLSSSINITSSTLTTDIWGTAAQGGGLFAGGAVSAGSSDSGTNNSSSGTVIISISSSSVNITSSTLRTGNEGTAAQGGGIFAGGAVSAGSDWNGTNNSSSGTVIISFLSSSVNIISSTLSAGDYGTAAQGGGIFAGGAVSAGSDYIGSNNNSSSGTVIISFSSSSINITSSTLSALDKGTAAQGGGIFAGGAVSAGSYNSGSNNNSSSGTVIISISSSSINITSNTVIAGSNGTAVQGGGIFAGGAVSAGSYDSATNNSSRGTVKIDIIHSSVAIRYNSAIQGGGMFIAGSVVAGDSVGQSRADSGIANIRIEDSTAVFIGNIATNSGGAIYIAANEGVGATNGQATLDFINSIVSFISNTAENGGAIFALDSANINFNVSVVSFTSNTAAENGGAIYSDDVTIINFSSSVVNFISNTAEAGGAIFALGSTNINFSSSVVSFTSNTTENGGAIYSDNATIINFSSSVVSFTSNTAVEEGGAIFALDSANINFNGSVVSFTSNTAENGGAIYSDDATIINFSSSVVNFISNTVGVRGGVIYAKSNTNINFSSSTVKFTNNTSEVFGGAIFALDSANINFSSSIVSFISNTAGTGGAIFSVGFAKINFSSSIVNFTSNTAGQRGGALFARNDTNINFSSSVVRFTSNTAVEDGGAIYAFESANINFSSSIVSFINNSAQRGNGGAIYAVDGASITFNGGNVLFRGNTVGANPNDIYMDDSKLYLFANEYQIIMEGGILAYNGSEIIYNNVSGGSWYLSGINVFDNMGKFEIGANSVVTVQDSSWTYMNNAQALSLQGKMSFAAKSKDTYIYSQGNSIGDIDVQSGASLIFDADANRKIELNNAQITGIGNIEKKGSGTLELKGNINFSPDFTISQGVVKATAAVFGKAVIDTNGKYSMLNGVRIDSMTVTKDLIINGTLAIDVSFGVDFFDNWSDIVIVNNTVTIAQGKLELNVLQETEVIGSSLAIIYADGLGSGEFLESQFGRKIYTFEWVSQSGTIGANSYNNIGYLVFDRLIPPPPSPPLDEIAQGHNGKEIAQLITNDSRLGNLSITIEGLSNNNQKQMALKQLSGVFLINAITAAARPIGIENLYEHIRANNTSESRFWVEVYGQGHNIKEDENSVGDFKEEGFGARLGFDIYENSKDMLGFYVRYGKNDLKQAKDSATMIDAELGVYGGIFKYEKIRLKGDLGFGIGQFDVKRVIDVGAGFTPALNAKSEFNTQSIKIAGQVEYIIETKTVREIEVKPFIGFEGGYVHSGEILEEGAGEANLKVAEHNYLQAEALLGIGIGNKNINKSDRAKSVITWFIPTLLWNAKVYGGYLITDETPEYEISFRASEDKKMKIWGTDKGNIRAGLALSGEYLITEQVSVYSNLDASFGEKSLGYYANVGIGYRFAKGQAKTKPAPKPEPILAPAPIEEPKLELEPVTVPQVELEPMPIEVKEEEAQERRQNPQMESFKLEVAKFRTNTFELTEESKEAIKEIVNKIKAHEYKKITVEGHTDITGSQEYNIILSERRAKAVADEFIKNGIDPNKIEAIGFGPKIPIADNETLEGRIKNRRVEIFVE